MTHTLHIPTRLCALAFVGVLSAMLVDDMYIRAAKPVQEFSREPVKMMRM